MLRKHWKLPGRTKVGEIPLFLGSLMLVLGVTLVGSAMLQTYLNRFPAWEWLGRLDRLSFTADFGFFVAAHTFPVIGGMLVVTALSLGLLAIKGRIRRKLKPFIVLNPASSVPFIFVTIQTMDAAKALSSW